MKHWFIEWLEEKAVNAENEVAQFENAIVDSTSSEDNETKLEGMNFFVDLAERMNEWIRLANDMISLGLEKECLAYYDAKQSIGAAPLSARPSKNRILVMNLKKYLNNRIDVSSNELELKNLKEALTAVTQLFSVGMDEAARAFYLRSRVAMPELNLMEFEFPEGDR